MAVVFIRVVQTVVITIADVYPGDTVSIVTGEEVTKAGPALQFTVVLRLISSVSAVIVTVTVPRRRDTTVVGAPIIK